MKRKIFLESTCYFLAFLFSYAAANKLLDYEAFEVQIGLSPLLTGYADFIPWLVISVEFIISFFLLVPHFRLLALFASFSLMTMFTAYIVGILKFASFVPCACGGVLEDLTWTEHLIFNISVKLLALSGIVMQAGINRDPINEIPFNLSEARA